MSRDFQSFLQQKGIISQRSCPYTPQQNRVAERKNRHLLEVICTLLLESFVPLRFWVEALSTAVYLINRLPSQTLNLDSLYFHLFGVPPNYNSLHVFCYICFVHLPPIEPHKIPAQVVQYAFLGYSNSHKGFVCYDANNNKIRISQNVVFFENQYLFPSHGNFVSSSTLLPSFDDVFTTVNRFKPKIVYQRRHQMPLSTPEPTSNHVLQEPQQSTGVSQPPNRYGFSHSTLQANINTIFMPKSYFKASIQEC